jgi:hypothetical protein
MLLAGHQDDGIAVLDRLANLNIEVDSLAKVYWSDMVTNPKWKTPLLHMSTGRLVYVAKNFFSA